MKRFYQRLAIINLKSNRQFYLPYLLVGMFSAMLFYSIRAIQRNEGVAKMRGADILSIVLAMGTVIIGICVCIFLFYTNSFVMKRRRKELGMFNVLGMEKKHIIWVLFWEALFLYVASVGGGLVIGIVFNKLLTMFLYQLTGIAESIPFYISGVGCLQTAQLFGVMYAVLLGYNFIQVKRSNPIVLLHSTVGEREPRAKWIHAVFGIGCILVGYYLALTVQDLIMAIGLFFIAVILVIVGTYEVFMTGSIAFLKLLRKNKSYYYQTKHFITVSGMIYRMKQNAVGLANICILSTMVMVIVSTTVCMYAGIEDALAKEHDLDASFYYDAIPTKTQKMYLLEQMKTVIAEQGREVTALSEFMYMPFTVHCDGNSIKLYNDAVDYSNTQMGMLRIYSREDYEQYSGQKLSENLDFEEGMLIMSIPHIESEVVEIFGQTYEVTKSIEANEKPQYIQNIIEIVVDDPAIIEQIYNSAKAQKPDVQVKYEIFVDIDGTKEERRQCTQVVASKMVEWQEQAAFDARSLDSVSEAREEYLSLNGGFLFLGLFLGTMFLLITVLIIYYKQISEGYEDRTRFTIMTNVGLSRNEVKVAIRSQVRTVFFLPIVVAVIHLAAAFPMINLILMVFKIENTRLFIGCLSGTALVFLGLYYIVFKLTSQTYYTIVYR